jgi:hypothetical protein
MSASATSHPTLTPSDFSRMVQTHSRKQNTQSTQTAKDTFEETDGKHGTHQHSTTLLRHSDGMYLSYDNNSPVAYTSPATHQLLYGVSSEEHGIPEDRSVRRQKFVETSVANLLFPRSCTLFFGFYKAGGILRQYFRSVI